MFLYVVKHGAVLGISGGLLTVRYPDGTEDGFPKNTIEGISVFSKVTLTTACIEFCLANNINVGYFSLNGRYYGRLVPVQNVNVFRLRKQIDLSKDDMFSLRLAQKIIHAKINNQFVVARRYAVNISNTHENKRIIQLMRRKTVEADSLYRLIGYEGVASKSYFQVLSDVIDDDFSFEARNRRPAKDPFNCMLNFGYSLLTKEIIGEIEGRGLNPYIGFIHQDKSGHPTLASDLIEEWRPVIVDSLVMSMIQGHEIANDGFTIGPDGCRMKTDIIKLFIAKLEKRMGTEIQYLKYIDRPLSFREAIWHQVDRMGRAIDKNDPEKYCPVIIR